MTYPFSVTQYPDARSGDAILGARERTILGAMVRKPGHVLSADELTPGMPTPTARRMQDHVDAIRAVVGGHAVVDVPRRGWQYRA